MRLGRSSGIDFAFPADCLSLPGAAFKADNALAGAAQSQAALGCLRDEHKPSLAEKQGHKCLTSDLGLYLMGELGESSLMVGWE